MKLDSGKLIDILLREHYVSEDDVNRAKEYSKKHNVLITDYLLSEDIITKDLLGQAVSEALGVVYADLNSKYPSKEQVLKLSEDIAKKYKAVIFNETKDKLVVATDDPNQQDFKQALEKLFPNQKIVLAYSLTEDIESAFVYYRKSLETRFAKIIEQQKRVAPEIIDEIIADALSYKASDIHFEPEESEVVVRFRVDGVLHEAGLIPKEYYENILNRIKVQSKMRIDEHSAAQDGSIRYHNSDLNVDLRVSVVPTLEGEKVVIRVLAEYMRSLSLENLGLSIDNQDLLMSAAKKPFGMILVTGPTGSGKTTTLYSLIKLLNDPSVNITTIEDPAEYKIPGINQIQINTDTNLTFAKGLRSIIRQDPDIILVGEIRDEETAEIAVNAALTGHLLLSTFHSNDASTAIPRLLDMEVEPFLLASTLELVIAQRLVRKICEHCRYSAPATEKEKNKLKTLSHSNVIDEISTFYKGKGCAVCGQTGYRGRVAIYEFIKITSEMENLILKQPSRQQIWELAAKEGSKSLFTDGLEKVKSGVTTLEELLRVASPPGI